MHVKYIEHEGALGGGFTETIHRLTTSIMWIHNTNAAVARSAVGRYFRLEGSGHVSVIPSYIRRPYIDEETA